MTWQIAIDGPAGAGKSTIAKIVADKLGFVYLDTGAMFRAVAYRMQEEGIEAQDEQRLKELLNQIEISFTDGGKRIWCNGVDISKEIRSPEMSSKASAVSALPAVREVLAKKQREIAEQCNVVMDGRDIGTVILPNAQVKVFLTASLEERTRRRQEELAAKGIVKDFDELYEEIATRDKNDSSRAIAPLKMADDAVFLDSTAYNIDDVVKNVLLIIENKGFHIG